MQPTVAAISAILTAIIGLAIVAVLVSKNSQTGTVLTNAGTALSGLINAAVSPVSATSSGFGNFSNSGGLLQ
jgi:hypothetical protein